MTLEQQAQSAPDSRVARSAILDREGKIIAVTTTWQDCRDASPPGGSAIEEGMNYLRACDAATGEWAEDAGVAAAGIRAVLTGETETFGLEYPCHSTTGRHWFSLRVTRFLGDGPARAVVSHEDITARREAEEALHHRVEDLNMVAQTLERRNAEIDQFAYITAHDLRAPLRGIANLTRWIEEDLNGAITPALAGQFDLLRDRVSRLEVMIEGILQYSRIGWAEVAPEAVDITALLTRVIDLLAPPPGIAITLDDDMPTLHTQRLQLQQVFQNLLSNAIKHHDRAEGRVHVGVSEHGGWHEFTVADDGPGIAPMDHDKIWTIFQTLKAPAKGENTGVGLALVKKIVEAQGGAVGVTSGGAGGATFHFTWPHTPATGIGEETRNARTDT